jgi:hypothetical protein
MYEDLDERIEAAENGRRWRLLAVIFGGGLICLLLAGVASVVAWRLAIHRQTEQTERIVIQAEQRARDVLRKVEQAEKEFEEAKRRAEQEEQPNDKRP